MLRLRVLLPVLGLGLAGWSVALSQGSSDKPALPARSDPSPEIGGNDSGPEVEQPILFWHFDGEKEPGIPAGMTFEAGPRPPIYPSFPPDNKALAFGVKGERVVLREADLPQHNLRFTQGEGITLEAWVKVKDLRNGSYAYLIGKGRSRRAGFPEHNQNYALRLKGQGKTAAISFLFASPPTQAGQAGRHHRWTSLKGFPIDDHWHHVAIRYIFGKPESIRGVIDGQEVVGSWDLDGPTETPPVADEDHLFLGTGNGGGAGNTFQGWMDNVALWRTALPVDTLTARYKSHAPQPSRPLVVVNKADLPRGQIRMEICEDWMPASNTWPDEPLQATETYHEEAFGFFEVPHKYIDTGVRADRNNPFLLRAAAVVKLPAGKHRLLLRSRGSSRLYIDGQLVLSTPFPPPPPSGSDSHNPVRSADSYLNLGPDFRFAPPGNRESWSHYRSEGGEHLVVLETVVGAYHGKKTKKRPELGETVVALSPEGEESWRLLTPTERVIPYTDAGWAVYQAEREAVLARMNAQARASCRQQHRAYWDFRRQEANKWLASTPPVAVPPLPAGYPAHNAIDHFIAVEVEKARRQASEAQQGSVDYYRDVRPILEARCYDCHAGAKVKGGLRLDDRASAFAGGDGDGPGFTPGQPKDSAVLARVTTADPDLRMPPKGEPLTREQVALLEKWVREGARWPDFPPEPTDFTPLTDDLAFLRRLALDTVGVVPSLEEINAFLADSSADRRARAIDRYLADPRWADHQMGYWQDVLAENPNILNPTLNNTGPFRWWLYESFQDNKPMDLMVTELVRLKGSERFGGPAGFGVASQNDSPMAAKAVILASAFLGVEMKCARCHDAPAHASRQQDVFALAALLNTRPLEVPKTSSVPTDKIHQGGRKPLIQVTLQPGASVAPAWPWEAFTPASRADQLAQHPEDPRDRLAALLTAPENERFAQVIANRTWKRLMGRGLVEPVDDWERGKPTHPELLRWLGREFVASGYDLKQLQRLILNSHAYQRASDPNLKAQTVLYARPAPRRLAAEQIVDSLFFATGKPFHLEEVSLDIDGMRDLSNSITLGVPRRSWMLTSTSNERDRPSLALPRIQAVVDVLSAFGWRGARQEATSTREEAPNAMQPAILSNGTMAVWLTRLSDDHGLTALALREQAVDALIDELFLRILTRKPSGEERSAYRAHLEGGYAGRIRTPAPQPPAVRLPEPYVSWSNHNHPSATIVRQQQEAAARRGDPPTERLDPDWRNRFEDVLWALLNSPEFLFTP